MAASNDVRQERGESADVPNHDGDPALDEPAAIRGGYIVKGRFCDEWRAAIVTAGGLKGDN